MEEVALGEFEGEGDGSLLAFAGVFVGGHSVEADGEVVAMGADDGLAGGGFAGAGLEDGIFHAGAGCGEVGEGEGFVFCGDVDLCGGDERGELVDEFLAVLGDEGSVFDEDVFVGEEFGEAEFWFFEEEVFCFESAAVAGDGGSVLGVELDAEKVEEVASGFTGVADEVEVLVSHPDDEAAVGEVVGAGVAGLGVGQEEETFGGALANFAFLVPWVSCDAEAWGVEFGEGVEAVGTG